MSTPALLKRLQEKGYKLTKQRRQVVSALQQIGKRATARMVFELLKGDSPKISLDTVYRNLRLLTEVGIVHQINLTSGAVFELAGIEQHHHHMVCVDCESVVCIPYCPESYTYHRHAQAEGFAVLGHTFEIYGRCKICQKKQIPGHS